LLASLKAAGVAHLICRRIQLDEAALNMADLGVGLSRYRLIACLWTHKKSVAKQKAPLMGEQGLRLFWREYPVE
jgi:hypothetical protein